MGIEMTKLTQRIREEFDEAPGLRVTVSEAARFWGLDEPTCEQVLAHLFASGFLSRGSDRRYRQASGG
jgi:DNA-binding IclR family transcriptional regulator